MNQLRIDIFSKITIDKVKSFFKSNGYVFATNTSHFNNPVNIINVRSNERKSDNFDDCQIVIGFTSGGVPIVNMYDVTVDPGKDSLINPINGKGTAIVVPGQYLSAWAWGLHKGKYEALVQVNPISVYRDANKNDVLDMIATTIQTGLFGINCHRASQWSILEKVGLYSAGCTVHKDPKAFEEFKAFVKLYTTTHKTYNPVWVNANDLLKHF